MVDTTTEKLEGYREQYFQFACAREPEKASQVIDAALKDGLRVQDIYTGMILATQKRIGELYSEGRFGVADEHLVTQISISELARLRHFIRPKGRRNKSVAVVAVTRDQHTLGARVVADFFIMDGWTVHFLGGDVPSDELVRFVSENQVDLVALSVTLVDYLTEAENTIIALKDLEKSPGIMVGGPALMHPAGQHSCADADIRAVTLEQSIAAAQSLFSLPANPISFESFLVDVGVRVKSFRKARGLNQKAVAEESGLDRAYLSGIENGKQNLSMQALFKIAQALRVDVEDLVVERTDYRHF